MKKGMALILSILTLLVLSILATGLVMMSTMESRMTTSYILSSRALEYAQAGFSEAALRLKTSGANSISDNGVPITPGWVAVIASSYTGTPTNSDWHFYTSLANGIDSINIQYTGSVDASIFDPDDPETWGDAIVAKYKMKIDSTTVPYDTLIYFHDNTTNRQFAGDPALAESFSPVIEVYVKGTDQYANKTIKAEIAKVYRSVSLPAAWTIPATTGIHLTGRSDLQSCGHNHKYNTPYGTQADLSASGCYTNNCHVERTDGNPHPTRLQQSDDECSKVGCVAAVYTDDWDLWNTGPSTMDLHGNPDVMYDPNIRVNTPKLYELLGFSSETEMNNTISWESVSAYSDLPATPPADDDIKFYKTTGDLYIGGTRYVNGVLWVNGDLTLGNGAYLYTKGIIYVDSSLKKAAGNTWSEIWTLGAMVVGDNFDAWGAYSGHRMVRFLYCKKSHDLVLEKTGNVTFQILGWKEIAE